MILDNLEVLTEDMNKLTKLIENYNAKANKSVEDQSSFIAISQKLIDKINQNLKKQSSCNLGKLNRT